MRQLRRFGLLMAATLIVVACGSSSKPNTATTVGPTATTPSETTQPSNAAEFEITAAFKLFFDGGNTDVDARVAVLEHGAALKLMIADATADPQFSKLSTTVKTVTRIDDAACLKAGEAIPCAEVVHDLFLGTFPAFVGQKSYAVNVDGTWKVSAKSWCAIVKIGGAVCPAF